MIVYGSRAKQVASETLMEKCPNCSSHGSVQLFVYQKYAHVFWIPFFPIGKTGASQCSSCKQVLTPTQMPPYMQVYYQNLKAQTKIPIWTFSGIALIAAIIVAGVISDKNKNAKNAKLISYPQSGDILEIKTKEGQYTLYKVEKVQGDSAFIRLNNYETNMSTGLNDLKRKGDEAYSPVIFSFSKKELKEMYDKGEIFDIERKKE